MSESDEYFDESKYQISEEDKKEIDDNIVQKRQYNRKQPKKPQTEAQKAAFEKARAKLLENRQTQNARKSVPVSTKNVSDRNNISDRKESVKKQKEIQQNKRVSQKQQIINDPVNDSDYTDEENEDQFMITDANNKNYIVRPVVKRTKLTPPPKRKRATNNIKEKIDTKKLDNIVDTQIKSIERSKQPQQPQQHQYVNMYTHRDALKPTAATVNKRNRSLLDEF